LLDSRPDQDEQRALTGVTWNTNNESKSGHASLFLNPKQPSHGILPGT
jgi:hypothetical protein